MNKIVEKLRNSHMLPFLLVYGELHETYRNMVEVIYNANIPVLCVESLLHKEFCKEQ